MTQSPDKICKFCGKNAVSLDENVCSKHEMGQTVKLLTRLNKSGVIKQKDTLAMILHLLNKEIS